jgi:hypothetical protein
VHRYPHTRLTVRESFNYYDSAGTLRMRFLAGELANAGDPFIVKVWSEYPTMFEAQQIY